MNASLASGLVLASAFLLSGCVGDSTPTIGPDDGKTLLQRLLDAIPLEAVHDHANLTAHAGAFHMEQVAYSGLNEPGTTWVDGEADVVGSYAYVATLWPKGGFVVVDIKDPAKPTVIGRYVAATTYAADVKVTSDGRWAVLGSQFITNQDQWMPPQHLPPADGSSVGINGFQLISLMDPARPRFVHFLPVEEYGVHMLDVHTIGGVHYAFGAPGAGGHVVIARIVDVPMGGLLVPVGKYLSGYPNAIGPHDVTVYDDPILGRPLMLVAHGTSGVEVVDVAIPMQPSRLGTWRQHDGRYVHTVMPAIVEGRRLLVATPEVFASPEQQPLWVLDATDVRNIHTISIWRLPGERLPYGEDYRFSTHNTNVMDGRIYLSHFHAGVWVLDISSLEKARAPEVLGAFVPAEGANLGLGKGLGLDAAPLVWDAIPLPSGHVLVADIPTGLYILTDPGRAAA